MENQSWTCSMGKFTNSKKNKVKIFFKKSRILNLVFSVIMRPAEVQLTVQHQLPVLLYESYPIKVQIKNCENVDIHSAM
jgi:hypothetical protein